MRFLHLADLHLGKMLYGYSLIEDQRYFLKQILDGLEAHRQSGSHRSFRCLC